MISYEFHAGSRAHLLRSLRADHRYDPSLLGDRPARALRRCAAREWTGRGVSAPAAGAPRVVDRPLPCDDCGSHGGGGSN